jgi:hypothetical protein
MGNWHLGTGKLMRRLNWNVRDAVTNGVLLKSYAEYLS